MAKDPPSSDSEDSNEPREYRYESEGEEQLGTRARALLREANGDYHRKFFFFQTISRMPDTQCVLFQWHELRCSHIQGNPLF